MLAFPKNEDAVVCLFLYYPDAYLVKEKDGQGDNEKCENVGGGGQYGNHYQYADPSMFPVVCKRIGCEEP